MHLLRRVSQTEDRICMQARARPLIARAPMADLS